MTDLQTAQRSGKRERLVDAAADLFHHQGVEGTTLAHIAAAAGLPLGSLYYYFKTKDDIVRAVVDAHADRLHAVLRTLDRHRSPRARLVAFVRELAGSGDVVARWGCPHGALCSELDRRDDDLAEAAGALMRVRVDWAREQFRLMGRKDAHDLAIALISALQGASLLANTYRDPAVLASQVRQLQRWLNGLG